MRTIGLLLAILIAIVACGGGDDDDGGSSAGSTPTSTPAPMDPTISPTSDPVEAAEKLESAALALDDLPDGWVEAPELLVDSEDTLICGGESFESRFEWEAEHRVAYKVSDLGPIVVEGLRVTNPGVADEMMGYAREVFSCEEWTAEDGSFYTLSPLSTPTLGDGSFAIRITPSSSAAARSCWRVLVGNTPRRLPGAWAVIPRRCATRSTPSMPTDSPRLNAAQPGPTPSMLPLMPLASQDYANSSTNHRATLAMRPVSGHSSCSPRWPVPRG